MAKTENTTIHLNVLAASTLVTEAIIEYQKIDDEIRIQIQQNEQNDFYDIGVTTRLFYQEPESPHNSIFVCTEKIYLAEHSALSGTKNNIACRSKGYGIYIASGVAAAAFHLRQILRKCRNSAEHHF